MEIPSHMVVREAIVSAIEQENGEPGVYRVEMVFDGAREVFIIEIDRPDRFFAVRGVDRWRIFEDYASRCYAMKAISVLMGQWHRGQRRELPVNLASVLPA